MSQPRFDFDRRPGIGWRPIVVGLLLSVPFWGFALSVWVLY